MLSEKRKSRRTSVEQPVWIDRADGSPLVECVLANMSKTGAKLTFSVLPELPQEFVLRLSRDGRVARKCRVAWASERAVGVEFTARLVGATQARSGR